MIGNEEEIKGLIKEYNPYERIREGQEKAIIDVMKCYDPDAEEAIICELPAPTAFGKSLVCTIAMKILANDYDEDMVLGTTPLVELLKQYKDNPMYQDVPCLMGRNNYECALFPELKASDCIYRKGKKMPKACMKCAYRAAKNRLDDSALGWYTFDGFMRSPKIRGRVNCLFVDESAKIESILRNINSIELPEIFDEKEVLDSFNEWNVDLEDLYNQMCAKSDMLSEDAENDVNARNELVKLNRKIEATERKMQVIRQSIYYVENDIKFIVEHAKKETWNKVERKKEIANTREFKLLTAHIPFASMVKNLKFVVLSSATPSTNLLMAKEYNKIDTEHPIPVERRKLYFVPVGSMSYNSRIETAKKMAPVIANLHEMYDTKTMLHAGSYPVANLIYEELKKHMDEKNILLQSSKTRNECSKIFRNSTYKLIWISVEMNEGVDLNGKDYKLNIIAKLPAELWTAEYTIARNAYDTANFGYNLWYDTQTAQKLQQSYGRICRDPRDFGETWVLDRAAYSFWNRYKKSLFYSWFNEAVNIIK